MACGPAGRVMEIDFGIKKKKIERKKDISNNGLYLCQIYLFILDHSYLATLASLAASRLRAFSKRMRMRLVIV